MLAVTARVDGGDHKAEVFVSPYSSVLLVPRSRSGSGSNAKDGHSLSRAELSKATLIGWHFAGAATLKPPLRGLSLVGDISGHFLHFPGSDKTRDVTQITVMVGPRWSFFGGHRGMPFLHVMGTGAVIVSDNQARRTAGTVAVGGGVDLVRASKRSWGLRIEADYLIPHGPDVPNTWRISTGALFRFHDPHTVPCPCPSPTPSPSPHP